MMSPAEAQAFHLDSPVLEETSQPNEGPMLIA
jgi:hypothetical protein